MGDLDQCIKNGEAYKDMKAEGLLKIFVFLEVKRLRQHSLNWSATLYAFLYRLRHRVKLIKRMLTLYAFVGVGRH